MSYYALNGVPTTSPIDIALKLRIVCLKPHSQKIEAFVTETGLTTNGPWTKFIRIPSDPHSWIVFPNVPLKKSGSISIPDIGDALSSHVFDMDHSEIQGWMFLESPNWPPQFEPYLRIGLEDQTGRSQYTIIDMRAWGSQDMDLTEGVTYGGKGAVARWEDLTNTPVLRPFPIYAYWTLDPDNKTLPQGFNH